MGRDRAICLCAVCDKISIHSPRMGRDKPSSAMGTRTSDFNPLSPHGVRPFNQFFVPDHDGNFNPLSPHGERLRGGGIGKILQKFQSTLPAWGETWTISFLALSAVFQSTLPAWGETKLCNRYNVCRKISIHSPRMGRDGVDQLQLAVLHYFNPLSPHGERRQLP